MGLGSVITAPILGAKEGGFKGFCMGLGAGVVAGATLITTGAVVGIFFI